MECPPKLMAPLFLGGAFLWRRFSLVRTLLTKVLRGNNPGKECKSSQAPQRNPHLYTEEAQAMPNEFYFSPCETSEINGQEVYVFETSAPKLTGFVHPLFYESLENRRTSTNRYPEPNSESHPTERFKNGIASNTFVSAGMHPILDNEGDVAAFYSINDAYYEARVLLSPIRAFAYAAFQVWDNEETYVYDGYCQQTQFVGALRDYPGFKMASGADYRFDSSRDGCSDEVKRGRTEAYNFLSSLHDQPGCKKTLGTGSFPHHCLLGIGFVCFPPPLEIVHSCASVQYDHAQMIITDPPLQSHNMVERPGLTRSCPQQSTPIFGFLLSKVCLPLERWRATSASRWARA